MRFNLHDVPQTAARVMLCCGWGWDDDDEDLNLTPDDLDLIRALGVTHVSIGINSIPAAENEHRWALTNTVRTHGEGWVSELQSMGIVAVTHAWMVPDAQFVEDAAESIAHLHKQWGFGMDMPNIEEVWRGTLSEPALNRHRKRGKHKKAKMLKVAHGLNKAAAGRRYVEALREHGCTSTVCPSVVRGGPPAMRPMVEVANGGEFQMMSFDNSSRGGHATAKPPYRQDEAWRDIRRKWKHKGENFLMWAQQALYHQEDFGPPGEAVWVLRACNASLRNGTGHHDKNLAYWSLYWLYRNKWAAAVIASYSPKHRIIGWDAS